jgi:hypothetical protein
MLLSGAVALPAEVVMSRARTTNTHPLNAEGGLFASLFAANSLLVIIFSPLSRASGQPIEEFSKHTCSFDSSPTSTEFGLSRAGWCENSRVT